MIINYSAPHFNFDNIQLKDVGEESGANYQQAPKQRFHYIIHYIVDGYGVYTNSSATFKTENKLSKNQVFGIFKYDTINYTSNTQTPFYYLWVGFDGKEGDKLMRYAGFSEEHPIANIKNPQEVLSAFRAVISSYKQNNNYDSLINFLILIKTLRKNNEFLLDNMLVFNKKDTLLKAEKYMQAHLRDNLSVDKIAEHINMSRSHFSRIFKAHYKVSPHEYLIRLRLKTAEYLLKSGENTISEIADMLNFADIYSFSKQFKKYYGKSPSEYKTIIFSEKNDYK